MKYSLVIIYFLMSALAYAQSPGFQGKRFSISMGSETSFFSKLYQPVLSDTLKPYTDILAGIRVFPEIRIAGTFSRSLEWGLCYKKIHSSFLLDRIYQINSGFTELYIRKYEKTRGGLAPLGTWVQGGLVLIQSNFNLKPESEESKRLYNGAMTFGMGMQRAIGSRWLVDAGWELFIPPQIFMSEMKLAPGYYQSINDYYKNISGASLSSVKLRLGFLIF